MTLAGGAPFAPLPAVAQTVRIEACTAAVDGAQGAYVSGTAPQISPEISVSCDWASAATGEPPGSAVVCLAFTRVGGPALRFGTDEIPYDLSAGAASGPVLADAAWAAFTTLDIPAVADGQGATTRAVTRIHLRLPDEPAGRAGLYAGTLGLEGYVAASDTGAACDGTSGRVAGGTFTATTELLVELTAWCGILTTEAVRFGVLEGGGQLSEAATGQGGVAVQCGEGAAYTLYLGDGLFPADGERRMTDGQGHSLPYRLCKDAGCLEPWSEDGLAAGVGGVGGVGGVTKVFGEGSALTTVHGSIPRGTRLVHAGTYTDTVRVTVAY
ncbi:spore coat protein U domain-containing protein [Brevundimonas sp.]|uniref:spore coat protein U domain-containing protein n=1 Tax=Brevundimonas sp. TaxID=1871086 RepID=UPI0037C0E749